MNDTNITTASLDVTDTKLRRGGDRNFVDLKAAAPASVAGRPIHPFSLHYTAPAEGAVPAGGKLVVLAMPFYQHQDFAVGIGSVPPNEYNSYTLHSVHPPETETLPEFAAELTIESPDEEPVSIPLTRTQLEQLVRLLVMRLHATEPDKPVRPPNPHDPTIYAATPEGTQRVGDESSQRTADTLTRHRDDDRH